MKLKLLGFLGVALALSACPNIDTGEDGGATGPILVTPKGGIFVRQGAVLDIPANAVAQDTTIVLTIVDTGIPEVPDRKRISYGYRFSPSTLVFKAPIKMYLPWLADRVPQAVDPATFDMRRQQGSDAYLQLGGLVTHADLTAMEAQTDRLGLFWDTAPSKPNIARLEIDPTEEVLRVGDTKQFTARVIDPTGAQLDVDVAYRTVPARVGSITPDGGLFTALDPGTATIIATAADQEARATVHVQGSTAGPQSFVHENPFPTGNDLWGGMVLPGALGVVYVGANGTVLHQQSTGWTRLFSTPGVTFKAVAGNAASAAAAVGVQGTNGVLVELAGSGAPKTVVLKDFDPRSLWFNGTSGMAVGLGNDVLVRKNGNWVRDDSPSFETLLHVVGDGAGGFVTVGGRGSIYKWDPVRNVWDSLYQTQLATLLTAAHITDATGMDVWAAGGGKLWHFANGGWTAQNMPSAPLLAEVSAIGRADGKLFLTGRANKDGWVLSYDFVGAPATDAGDPSDAGFDGGGFDDGGFDDGGFDDGGFDDGGTSDGGTSDGGSGTDGGFVPTPGWTAFPLRAPQIPRGFFSSGPASTDAYVVGDLGAVYKYAGNGTFTELSSGFYGDVVDVKVASGGEVFVAANTCANPQCTAKTGAVYQRTGPGQWTQVGNQSFTEIFSMTARSATEVMVATIPSVLRWDGTSWMGVPVTGGVSQPIRNMKFCGNTLHGVGNGGVYYRGGSTTLTLNGTVGGTNLFGFDCPTEDDLWTAGTRFLAEKPGSAQWSPRNTTGINHSPYYAVWSPGVGEAYAFGDSRYGMYWNTEELQVIDAPGGVLPEFFLDMWGSSVDNLYLVGLMSTPIQSGLAVRFDGYQWRVVDSGAQRAVTCIDGKSSTEVWLGTVSGGVLRAVPP